MGKGSRNREIRVASNQANDAGSVKLSKKQLIRLQEKKARTKKYITTGATVAIIVAIVVAIVIMSIPKTPNLEGSITATSEYFEIDNAMFAFLVYDNLSNYSSYLSYYGYNTSLSLRNQTSLCAFDKSMTWYEYFCKSAISSLNQYVALASAAKAEGMELSDEDVAEIDEYFKELKTYANQQGYRTLDKFFSAYYTAGITASAVRRVVEMQYLASAYVEKYVDSLEYTDEEKLEYREKNPGSFNMIDYVYYDFVAEYEDKATDDEIKAAYAAAKAAAEEFMGKYTDVDSFKNAILELEKAAAEKKDSEDADAESTDDSDIDAQVSDEDIEAENEKILSDFVAEGEYYDEDAAEEDETKAFYEWAYSTDRAVNDMYLLESEDSDGDTYYTVYIISKPVYINDYTSKNVRHILFSVDTDLKDDELEEAFEEALEEAEKILEEYNNGEKNAERFAALAKEHTDDSNGEDGGLYENVLKGEMVEEFENWIYDESRVEGDVELVKTKYGWHIMYYVGDGTTAWKVTAEDGLIDDDYADHLKNLQKTYSVTYDYEVMLDIG